MIINKELDNTIIGSEITIHTIDTNNNIININDANYLKLAIKNTTNWIIGWGDNLPYYDEGSENLYTISEINFKNGDIKLGNHLRGQNQPKTDQKIVFWKRVSNEFDGQKSKIVIDTTKFKLKGNSLSFSNVVFDSLLNKWIILFNETDNSNLNIYAAESSDLEHWKPTNNGKPILTEVDFIDCNWAGYNKMGQYSQTGFPTQIIRKNNKWYLFMHGHNKQKRRQIGVAISTESVIGKYKIIKEPLISYSDINTGIKDVFYPKICKHKNSYVMLFDCLNYRGVENVGFAKSTDLLTWKVSNKTLNIHNKGWNSSLGTSEPVLIKNINDSLFVLIAGAMKYNNSLFLRKFTNKAFKDRVGNVDDIQWGLFYFDINNNKLIAHGNNPIFINDYSNKHENGHLGASLSIVSTDTANYIFYQAKTYNNKPHYNIVMRRHLYN